MNARMLTWMTVPVALSAGVLWLSAQENAKEPKVSEGVKVAEMAKNLQDKEKQLVQKEADLHQLEQRLFTLQTTLDKDRQELLAKEKSLQELQVKLEALKNRANIDPQIIRTYEAMDPVSAAPALKELAGLNQEVAVALLGGMTPKKAARIMDQVALLPNGGPRLAGLLSEKVGLTRTKPAEAAK